MALLRQSKTKEINGTVYEVTQLGGVKGSQVFVRVLKMLGPLLSTKPDMSALLANLKEEDMTYLCDAFSAMTCVQGEGQLDRPMAFDNHFAGKYLQMCKWLAFCLEVNFQDFFGETGLRAGVLQALVGSRSVSQSTSQSTGSSGASSAATS